MFRFKPKIKNAGRRKKKKGREKKKEEKRKARRGERRARNECVVMIYVITCVNTVLYKNRLSMLYSFFGFHYISCET